MMHFTLFLCFSLVVSCVSSSSEPKCHPNERSALLRFHPKYSSNGSVDCCSWEGVECDDTTGHVIGLQVGQLGAGESEVGINKNSSLFLLRHLQRLKVYGSQALVISEAPFESLASLKELVLVNVNMSSVPIVSLANLSSSLTTLALANTRLLGEFPDHFFHFPKLENLIVIDPWGYGIGISEAGLRELAKKSTNLNELDLDGVNMSSVPLVSLRNFSSSLTALRLSSCLLNGELPDKLFTSFPKLEFLDLQNNNINGHVPELCIRNSTATLGNHSSSCVVGSPPSNLTTLFLAHNSIRGSIPSWIFELPYLEYLVLANNLFTGEIGDFLTSSLINLRLENNRLQGVITKSIFHQTNLQDLDLSSNNLTGTVDVEELLELRQLYHLTFSSNNLTLSFNKNKEFTLLKLYDLGLASCNLAEFPPFLKSLKSLERLDLSNNRINGSVPTWLWEVGKNSIKYLNISHNFLTYIDTVPLYNLEYLDLRSNSFSGPLPIILAPSLYFLSVSKNLFSGDIPTSICNLTSTEVIDLSYNNLIGEIPRCIGDLSERLSVLDLRHNKLRGTISTTFVEGNTLRSLYLNWNRLEGTIPRSLINCTSLEVLDLGNNVLNDTFPEWLESLPELQVLVLRANNLYGSIGNPKSGSSFLKLRIMDLSQNEFTGELSSKYFESFKAMQMDAEKVKMEYMGGYYYKDSVTVTMKGFDFVLDRILTIFITIDFSRNNFSGEIPKVLGELVSLKGLNLSHNNLGGTIPSSFGSLSNLEWLDISSNNLVGEIPNNLLDVTSLSFMNLSHNHLEGRIPQGKQFNTFPNESFIGNKDLCGFPLSKSCGEEAKPTLQTLEQDENEDDDSSLTNGFNWRIVMVGFASGFAIGISIGYMLLYSDGKLCWLSERFAMRRTY